MGHKSTKKKTTLTDLVNVMARLRGPNGCPWDREQTHTSLVRYFREETEEVVQAVRKKDMRNLKEELGDVLLQILFHAQLAAEKKRFDINDVLAILKKKLVSRHPHVFNPRKGDKNLTAAEVKQRWKKMKQQEKAF